MDFEMLACGKCKSEEAASQGQGRRQCARQWQTETSERDVLRRLVDVLTTLSLVNAADLRELTATVFKTYQVPAQSSWLKHWPRQVGFVTKQLAPQEQARGGARRGSRTAQSGGDEGAGARTRVGREVLLGEQRGEERASAAGCACTALSGEAVQEKRGQGRLDAHRVLPGPRHPPPRWSPGSSAVSAEGSEEARPGTERTPRARSVEAPGTDAAEVERLTRRLELHSHRMAELLRRGVLEPSLACAFLMKKRGQQVPLVKAKVQRTVAWSRADE